MKHLVWNSIKSTDLLSSKIKFVQNFNLPEFQYMLHRNFWNRHGGSFPSWISVQARMSHNIRWSVTFGPRAILSTTLHFRLNKQTTTILNPPTSSYTFGCLWKPEKKTLKSKTGAKNSTTFATPESTSNSAPFSILTLEKKERARMAWCDTSLPRMAQSPVKSELLFSQCQRGRCSPWRFWSSEFLTVLDPLATLSMFWHSVNIQAVDKHQILVKINTQRGRVCWVPVSLNPGHTVPCSPDRK